MRAFLYVVLSRVGNYRVLFGSKKNPEGDTYAVVTPVGAWIRSIQYEYVLVFTRYIIIAGILTLVVETNSDHIQKATCGQFISSTCSKYDHRVIRQHVYSRL